MSRTPLCHSHPPAGMPSCSNELGLVHSQTAKVTTSTLWVMLGPPTDEAPLAGAPHATPRVSTTHPVFNLLGYSRAPVRYLRNHSPARYPALAIAFLIRSYPRRSGCAQLSEINLIHRCVILKLKIQKAS